MQSCGSEGCTAANSTVVPRALPLIAQRRGLASAWPVLVGPAEPAISGRSGLGSDASSNEPDSTVLPVFALACSADAPGTHVLEGLQLEDLCAHDVLVLSAMLGGRTCFLVGADSRGYVRFDYSEDAGTEGAAQSREAQCALLAAMSVLRPSLLGLRFLFLLSATEQFDGWNNTLTTALMTLGVGVIMPYVVGSGGDGVVVGGVAVAVAAGEDGDAAGEGEGADGCACGADASTTRLMSEPWAGLSQNSAAILRIAMRALEEQRCSSAATGLLQGTDTEASGIGACGHTAATRLVTWHWDPARATGLHSASWVLVNYALHASIAASTAACTATACIAAAVAPAALRADGSSDTSSAMAPTGSFCSREFSAQLEAWSEGLLQHAVPQLHLFCRVPPRNLAELESAERVYECLLGRSAPRITLWRCASCAQWAPMTCARCKSVCYCGAACQKAHWLREHKVACASAQAATYGDSPHTSVTYHTG